MPSPLDHSPPRLSDVYGEARLDALYRRAAADRERYRARQIEAGRPGLFGRLVDRLRPTLPTERRRAS